MLATTAASISYQGNGSTTVFSWPYDVIDDDDLKVYFVDSDDVETLQLSGYTAALVGSPTNGIYSGATVTFSTAPSASYAVKIVRAPDLTQEFDFDGEADPLPVITRYADLTEMKLQDLRRRVDEADGDASTATWVVASGSSEARSLADRFADVAYAEDFGFVTGGGNADATANTTALQAALDSAYWVILPAGTAYINLITHTQANRLTGHGKDKTILVLGNTQNTRMFLASSKSNMIYEDFTIDMNYANNTGSGSHDGIRLDTCTSPIIRRIRVTGAQGLFSGSPVGGGVSLNNGSGVVLDGYSADACYDGYQLTGHTDGRDWGSALTACLRNGGTVGSGSHRFEHSGVYAVGNCTTYAGAGLLCSSANDVKGNGGYFASNTLGHGMQYNTCTRAEQHEGTFASNGISGLDFYACTDAKVFGGYGASNTVRGLEIDSAANGTVVFGFQGASNGDVDISVYRSADVQLFGCEGNVRGWDASALSSASVAAGGSGYTNGTFTVTLSGGTYKTQATLSVTVAGGAVTTVNSVSNAGDYWTLPTEPASVTGLSGGSGATFNLVWTGETSGTVARLQITGGHQSDTINLVAGACATVRLTNLKASTITDPSAVAVTFGCSAVADTIISDTAYDATSWNGVTTAAPSKNAVRDQFAALPASQSQARDTTNVTNLLTPGNAIDLGFQRKLFSITAADMNSTSDQSFTKIGTFTSYMISLIRVRGASISLTTAQGGIYTGAGKTGSIIAASTQAYTGATNTSGTGQGVTLATTGTGELTATPILSLTIAQGAAATAIYEIYGQVLS